MVGGSAVHEVGTRADVRVRSSGDKVEAESAAAGGDTVGTRVISTIESTVLSTGGRIGAESGVPSVAGVAVGVTTKSSGMIKWQVSEPRQISGVPASGSTKRTNVVV